MRNIIKPFEKVGELKFGMDRNFINTSILKEFNFDSVQNKNIKNGVLSINDYFENGLVLGYLQIHLSLRYVVLSDPCEAIFEGEDLLAKTYSECLKFMKKFDSDIEEEEYVGFTSYRLGIAIYAPDGTDDPDASIEAVTIAEKGYFEKVKL